MRLLPVLVLMVPLWARAQGRQAVVVELFTSEGCSSCPDADVLLAALEQSSPVPGVAVIALEEHVDYWNQLGWADPFSSPAFTARQAEYATRFGRDAVYTPQAVVDGAAQLVGTRASELREQLRLAALRPAGKIALALKGQALQVKIDGLPEGEAELLLAVTESGLSTVVPRGENAGRHLRHASVVRRLQAIGHVRAGAQTLTLPLSLPSTIARRERARVVVFAQATDRRILAAAALDL